MLRIATLLISLFLALNAAAQEDKTQQTYHGYLDEKHKSFSKYVVKLFDNVDKSISLWVKESDNNKTDYETNEDEVIYAIDEFFKNEKFIEETEKSFLRIRLGSEFQSKESIEFNQKISAQIPLSRTKKNIQLFIGNSEKNYLSNVPSGANSASSVGVGVNLFTPFYKGIKSKYSIGIKSFSTYAKARYSKDFKTKDWLLQPTQQFIYSTKDDFSEETNIYLNKTLNENSIFRTTLHRKTQSNVDGFDYAVAFSYYLALSQKKGFSFTQQFWGNSEYRCEAAPQKYDGISSYSSFASWRQNIFRKWIALEIKSGVDFHRQYEYEPNYIFRFDIDFYFGNI
ncbi:hypothetical protein [Sulfurimonas sp.]|jgi:hypothetical protein|uniref:hypothetical protein n=1 Tax=Sulfurimonas sp. TaxID=2022749 RepID=UPI0025F04DE6|nr:hypothetical protein [Sulfurimonas sp.]MCK9472917.1 hypothetical protein [Sulfurimonas sp.]MDD3506298.1 hypothetical protein [Sulfurimonas sp.]